jgi:hypothetical protein
MEHIDLHNFFKFYDENNPNHVEGVKLLEDALLKDNKELLLDSSPWVVKCRTKVEKPKEPTKIPPFYPQTDNYTQPDRTCNSSSCAMALEYYKPGSLPPGPTGDNAYLKKVLAIGDSTDHEVQTKVLESYGLKSRFSYTMSFEDLDNELKQNKPVIIAILHRGTLSNPKGGHIIIAYQKLENGNYRCHDPYGDLYDGYTSSVYNGKSVIYEASVLKRRWTADGPKTGWGRIFTP